MGSDRGSGCVGSGGGIEVSNSFWLPIEHNNTHQRWLIKVITHHIGALSFLLKNEEIFNTRINIIRKRLVRFQ